MKRGDEAEVANEVKQTLGLPRPFETLTMTKSEVPDKPGSLCVIARMTKSAEAVSWRGMRLPRTVESGRAIIKLSPPISSGQLQKSGGEV